jgi:hypothetical protein
MIPVAVKRHEIVTFDNYNTGVRSSVCLRF